MKITKFIALAAIVALLSACEKQKDFMDEPDVSDVSVNGVMSGVDMNNSYLVISRTNKLPKGLENAIAKANGKLESTIPEVGIAVAISHDPDFKGKAAKIAGIQSVVPNLTIQWLDPNEKMKSFDPEANQTPIEDDEPLFWLQWGHDAIDAPEAWDAGYTGKGVLVGVLDGGFDLTHPDLVPNISGLSKDFTGEGLPYAGGDHGTHTAGTIAAADNSFGVIGVAPEAKLVLIKVMEASGSGDFNWVIQGIIYAANNDVDVINMSIGAYLEKSGVPGEYTAKEAVELKNALGRAVAWAYQSGTTVIASAGNDALDFDHSADLIHLPSGVPHAISISATAPIGWAIDPTTNLDLLASYSNYGQSEIDFAAPGGDYMYPGNELCSFGFPCWVFDMVFSTFPGGWAWMAGTSMAAPHATGVAALIIGKNGGDMKPADVKEALKDSADDLGKPGNDDFYGQGRVNAYEAVK